MVQASNPDASWMPPWGGIAGTSKWEESTEQTQNMMGGLCNISSVAREGLGVHQEQLEDVDRELGI